MTKENIHPVTESRICCQDSRWMSEYWWSWKTPPGAFFNITPLENGMGVEGRAYTGIPWTEAPFSIFRIPECSVAVSKGDQSHFEALGASSVCEGCEVLPKWLCQFFKTHLHLTLCASAVIVSGAQVRRRMMESSPLQKASVRMKI